MAAMPMMPMEPAKAVSAVRPFLVMRLLNESESAVRNPIEARLLRRLSSLLAPTGGMTPVTSASGSPLPSEAPAGDPPNTGVCAAAPSIADLAMPEVPTARAASSESGSVSPSMRPSCTRMMRVA